MSIYAMLFYALAAITLGCTIMAVTRRVLVHAVVWMVGALIGTALIFLLLGAPLLAGFEVIIYAGAIMVLFLFAIMLMAQDPSESKQVEAMAKWRIFRRLFWPAIYGLVGLLACMALISFDPANTPMLKLGRVSPHALGAWVFGNAWPAVEAVSLLLFIALAGARYLGLPLVRADQPRRWGASLKAEATGNPEPEPVKPQSAEEDGQ
ncbi:NADH-quinone oxidoreductase subunit J [Oceanidesulfovibrio marinus]|uniref:NADH-quinone oxidoreductase subunit J n=1 Tax=Oceanidesulfovibrio marinus TaxID=370038 RepID=A0A6P1ZGI7_9BACT|nr:NADH-quinone oxidoreductase subunit J [Oceanidesulfovibrio marinus]TVM33755.1 NADH-ubiquinone/plastoquinone oxidoreductase subunit 6 [Oceanidesulfovibrio marinus]